jgi:hypothetical protein
MFESLCALLFRCYPLAFRRTHGREAWRLIQDRAREERRIVQRLRLLMDLMIDVIVTATTWRPSAPVLAHADGGPRFDFIEPHRPRPQAMAAGTITSMAMLVTFGLLFEPRVFPPAPAQLGEGTGEPRGFEAAESGDQPQVVGNGADIRHALVSMIAASIRDQYFDTTIGSQLADALLAFDQQGRYERIGTGPELAVKVTEDIYATGRAIGIPAGAFVAEVVYSPESLNAPPPGGTASTRERDRLRWLDQNCRFERIELLAGNIGYLKLNAFPPAWVCQPTATHAMTRVNGASALIVDLRDNGGGMGEIALDMAGYLFDRPAFLWDPRPHSQVPSHTASPVEGSKLVDTPVFLLTSARTQSAAEYFVYNLKMLKRVTIVGERTAGHQHSGRFHVLDDQFGIAVQSSPPPVNPYAIKGWERIGVDPDVAVGAGEALDVARVLAVSRSRKGTR